MYRQCDVCLRRVSAGVAGARGGRERLEEAVLLSPGGGVTRFQLESAHRQTSSCSSEAPSVGRMRAGRDSEKGGS